MPTRHGFIYIIFFNKNNYRQYFMIIYSYGMVKLHDSDCFMILQSSKKVVIRLPTSHASVRTKFAREGCLICKQR